MVVFVARLFVFFAAFTVGERRTLLGAFGVGEGDGASPFDIDAELSELLPSDGVADPKRELMDGTCEHMDTSRRKKLRRVASGK